MTSKTVCKVMVSGAIFKIGTIISKCNTEKKSDRYIKGKNYKKIIRESGIFRENMVNRSPTIFKKINRSRGFYLKRIRYADTPSNPGSAITGNISNNLKSPSGVTHQIHVT